MPLPVTQNDWDSEPILHSICASANDIGNWEGGYVITCIEEGNGMAEFPLKDLVKPDIDTICRNAIA